MKKAKRLLTGLLCVVMFLTNIMTTGIQVSAAEVKNEQTYVGESQNEEDIMDGADNTATDDDAEKEDSRNGEVTTSEEPDLENSEQEELMDDGSDPKRKAQRTILKIQR